MTKAALVLVVGGWTAGWLPAPVKTQYVKETKDNSAINNSGGDVGTSHGNVTTIGKTLWEAQCLTNFIIMPKDTPVIGYWKVQSLYRGGTTVQVAIGKEGYKLDILGISECRWTGARRQRITSGQTVLFAGDEKVHKLEWPL